MASIRSRTVASALALTLVGSPAHAEPSSGDKALAESLFIDGKKLMEKKKYSEACPKLAESHRLDPAGGTLLNLALCHELEGKTATAWVEFNDALIEAQRDKRPERVKLAKDHVEKLASKLSRLTINVPKEVRMNGLKVTRDGIPVNDVAWGTAVPLDPGAHVVVAAVPGRVSFEARLSLDTGEQRIVTVPVLDHDPGTNTSASPAELPPPPPPKPDRSGRRMASYVVGGAGVLALGVGGFFGLRTLSQQRDSDSHCPSSNSCDASGVAASDSAHRSATVANVGVGLGLIALGVGTYLFLTSRSEAPQTGLRLTPTVGSRGGSFAFGGAL